MSGEGSVTHWFEQAREADSAATRALWERYFPQLVRLAREKLRGAPRGAADEQDVAAGVMASLFRAAEAGRFPNLADRDELWRLLLKMTARKAVDLGRRETRQCRGGGRVKGESALRGADDPDTTGASRRFVSAARSLDGRYVVAVGSDRTTTVWDAGVEFPAPRPKPPNSP